MDKNYTSPSTGNECTSAQYIAEIVCTRKNKKDGQDTAYKFWNKSQKDQFRSTITSVSKLIKAYGEKQVVSYFLNDGKHVWSTGYFNPHPWLKEAIAKYADAYNRLEAARIKKLEEEKIAKEAEAASIKAVADVPKPKKNKSLFGALNG